MWDQFIENECAAIVKNIKTKPIIAAYRIRIVSFNGIFMFIFTVSNGFIYIIIYYSSYIVNGYIYTDDYKKNLFIYLLDGSMSTKGSSTFVINPDIPEATKLRSWYLKN